MKAVLGGLMAVGGFMGLALVASAPVDGVADGPPTGASASVDVTEWHAGQAVQLTANGCLNATTKSAEGYHVTISLLGDPRSEPWFYWQDSPASADGNVAVDFNVHQPIPSGHRKLIVRCLYENDTGVHKLFTYDPIEVNFTPEPISGLKVDDDVISFDDMCSGLRGPTPPGAGANFQGLGVLPDFTIGNAGVSGGRQFLVVGPQIESGHYVLAYDCAFNRVPQPEFLYYSPIDYVRPSRPTAVDADGHIVASALNSTASQVELTPPAQPIDGEATFTG